MDAIPTNDAPIANIHQELLAHRHKTVTPGHRCLARGRGSVALDISSDRSYLQFSDPELGRTREHEEIHGSAWQDLGFIQFRFLSRSSSEPYVICDANMP
jgi:hypothetical protein